MSTDRLMRASGQDRDKAAQILRDAYAAGRLNMEKFGERSLAAFAARTWGELDDLTADLPAPPSDGLPSDIMGTQNAVRYISYRRRVGKAVGCLLLLLARDWPGGCFPTRRGGGHRRPAGAGNPFHARRS